MTENTDPRPEDFLDAYLAGSLDPTGAEVVRRYVDATSARSGIIAGLRAALRSEALGPVPSIEESLQAVWRDVDAAHALDAPVVSSRSGRVWRRSAIAAGLVGLVVVVGLMSRARSDVGTSLDASSARFVTQLGQRSTVRLPNGARMTLAPGTTVSVRARVVHVNGEVFFDVASHAQEPFTVQTKNAVVQVLGTAFVVRHYDTDAQSQVVVESGKVSIRPRSANVGRARYILTSGSLARIKDSTVVVTHDVRVDDVTGWRYGRLVFDESPLRDVVVELSRAYGARIRLADSVLGRQPMTITARVGEQSLPDVLDLIGRATNSHVVRISDAFVLERGRSSAVEPRNKNFPQPERQYGR